MYRIDPKAYDFEYDKDKWILSVYEPFLAGSVGKGIKLLELGVLKGASLRFWCDYLENATVVGLDRNSVDIHDEKNRIHTYQGIQQDTLLIDTIAREQAPKGFDVVIDDCSHIGRFTRISFWHIFMNHLKPGGIYIIEDYSFGYVGLWPDGRNARVGKLSKMWDRLVDLIIFRLNLWLFSFSPRSAKVFSALTRSTEIRSNVHGMAGFIKELMDVNFMFEDRHILNFTHGKTSDGESDNCQIAEIHIYPHAVIVLKSQSLPRSEE